MPMVALLTDYRTDDWYVAALKGVISGLAPQARIADVTHHIKPQNVQQGAFALRQVWPWFPNGTVYVAVVDPGVGTDRRIVAGTAAGRTVVAPDNGLLGYVDEDFGFEQLRVVENRAYFLAEVSATFHGRDIMAPVAAHLANGVPLSALGAVTDGVAMPEVPGRAMVTDSGLRGQIIYVDGFGTLVTNVRRDQLLPLRDAGREIQVEVDGTHVGPLRATFSDVEAGGAVALVGGGGCLEIAVNRGRAVDRFGCEATVHVRAV